MTDTETPRGRPRAPGSSRKPIADRARLPGAEHLNLRPGPLGPIRLDHPFPGPIVTGPIVIPALDPSHPRPIPVPDIDISPVPPRIDRNTIGVLNPRLLKRFINDPPTIVKIDAGTATRPIVVTDDALQRLVRDALATPDKTVVWTGPGRELLVRLAETRVGAAQGGIAFGFDIESGNGRQTASVMLAVATVKAPAGMIASGGQVELPHELNVWSESLVATAWQGLLTAAIRLCAQAGVDTTRQPFVPAGVYAESGHVGFVPRRRYEWER